MPLTGPADPSTPWFSPSLAQFCSVRTRGGSQPRPDSRLDPAAHVEVPHDFHGSWRARRREVVQDPIHGSLVKELVVAIAPQVQLQALQLETHLIGYIGDHDGAEVR